MEPSQTATDIIMELLCSAILSGYIWHNVCYGIYR